MYHSTDGTATELLPYALRILAPEVKPVIVNTGSKATTGPSSTASVRKASEKALVDRSVEAMIATGVRFDRAKLEDERSMRPGASGWVFRMEPAIDVAGTFETTEGKKGGEGTRYAIRQVLDAEWRKEVKRRENEARGKRGGFAQGIDVMAEASDDEREKEPVEEKTKAKRDFFGRLIAEECNEDAGKSADEPSRSDGAHNDKGIVFCTFHEGYSNAVRKPVTLAELMRGL